MEHTGWRLYIGLTCQRQSIPIRTLIMGAAGRDFNNFNVFFSDLSIVVADPHRPGHEYKYHPGEANARGADVIVINKVDTADPKAVRQV